MASSANAVLNKFFNLPPALKMMLALAGFGSLATLLFYVVPSLRDRRTALMVVGVIAVVVGIVALIIFLRRRKSASQSSKLGTALSSQGPTPGDIAEQSHVYREKFREKLGALKNLGKSVYNMPWFILMGEPGCGKTASLIHSGLDFPLGRDEVPGFGGTRNYNWWFTEEAVILDTAGRIAFQEEGTTDRPEWEIFLKLLRGNRPRCPINGVIVALPADKLLRDNAEERKQKACVLRDRVRQIHQQLGVRFPTFVLVTKMDLVGGFSEFFAELRSDLQQRNQMFGWSRPGEFQSVYDPSTFESAFDTLYFRLRDWAMKYLQRNVPDEELGMVVTYPESFRQLKAPLNDYIETIFRKSQLIEPPFFRGFYFTSAVQEGAPIFDVLARTRGGGKVEVRAPRAADSKAFFIHDFYAHKVFPEQGLVFRSAQHVTLNRRMRRMVWTGSAAMIVLMLAFFGVGWMGVSKYIEAPKKTCLEASEALKTAAKLDDLPTHVDRARKLLGHANDYDHPMAGVYARALFVGASVSDPQRAVRDIHREYVFKTIVRPIVVAAEEKLKANLPFGESRDKRLKATAAYASWFGLLVGAKQADALTRDDAAKRAEEFGALLAVAVSDAPKDTVDQVKAAFDAATGQRIGELLSTRAGLESARGQAALRGAIDRLREDWLPYAALGETGGDAGTQFWAGFRKHVEALRERYAELLKLKDRFGDADRFDDDTRDFMTLTSDLNEIKAADYTPKQETSIAYAFVALRRFLEDPKNAPPQDEKKIRRLKDLAEHYQKAWTAEFDKVEEALKVGAPPGNAPAEPIYAAIKDAREALPDTFDKSLAALRTAFGVEADKEPLDVYRDAGILDVDEAASGRFDKPAATIRVSEKAFGPDRQLCKYLGELRSALGGGEDEEANLADLTKWVELLKSQAAAAPVSKELAAWFNAVRMALVDKQDPRQAKISSSALKEAQFFWKPAELYDLSESVWGARRKLSVTRLLNQMKTRCEASIRPDQRFAGLGQLVPGFDQDAPTLPFRRHRYNSFSPTEAPKPTTPEPEKPKDVDLFAPPTAGGAPAKPGSTDPLALSQGAPLLTQYHTRDFLARVLRAHLAVRALLAGSDASPQAKETLGALDAAADEYISRYFVDWYDLYRDPRKLFDEPTLALLDRCGKGELKWPEFYEELTRRNSNLGASIADRFEALMRESVLCIYALPDPGDREILERISARVGDLQQKGLSIIQTLRDLGVAARGSQILDKANPQMQMKDTLARTWVSFRQRIEKVGADGKGEVPRPDPEAVRKDLDALATWSNMHVDEFTLAAPLLDLASYSEELLRHHLDGKVAAIFADRKEHYPLIADSTDDALRLARVTQWVASALSPQDMVDFLRAIAQFQRDYPLYNTLRKEDDEPRRALAMCDRWRAFLYEDPKALSARTPDPVGVRLAVVKAEGVLNAAARYGQVEISLPLLTKIGSKAAGAITRKATNTPQEDVRTVLAGPEGGEEYSWSLFSPEGAVLPSSYAKVFELNADLKNMSFSDPLETAWKLSGSPWALLLLCGAQANNVQSQGEIWIIRLRMDDAKVEQAGQDKQIGFDVGVKFSRPFPGALPPYAGPGETPRMQTASRYLTGPGGARQ